MTIDPATIPVIIGVGQVNDRPDDPARGLDSLGLMAAALRAADTDAGGGWLAAAHSLSVVNQISCPWLGDMSATLAGMLGATPRICDITETAHGDYPIRLLNEAANRIGAYHDDTEIEHATPPRRTAPSRRWPPAPPPACAPASAW
jgi:acetyl-CoA C-acetyltransferase